VLIDRLTVRSVALKALTMPARDRKHALQVLEVVSQRRTPWPTLTLRAATRGAERHTEGLAAQGHIIAGDSPYADSPITNADGHVNTAQNNSEITE
jgi:hypothetical protein